MTQCFIADNASGVAISPYKVTQRQAGSTEVNMQKSGDNVPCSHENRIRISDLLFASRLLCVTEITKSALSLRITVLVELRILSAIGDVQLKDKPDFSNTMSNVQVWNLYGISKIWFHSIHQIFHSILGPFHIPYR